LGEHFRKHNAFRVIIEDEDVWGFEQRIPADFHAGRKAVEDGALGGADERLRTLVVVITFKVERDDKT